MNKETAGVVPQTENRRRAEIGGMLAQLHTGKRLAGQTFEQLEEQQVQAIVDDPDLYFSVAHELARPEAVQYVKQRLHSAL